MTYLYECRHCGKRKEAKHGMTESPEISCPICGINMKPVVTGGAGVIYKADGFTKAAKGG